MNAPAERASAQGADAWMRKLPARRRVKAEAARRAGAQSARLDAAGAVGNTLRLKTVAPSPP